MQSKITLWKTKITLWHYIIRIAEKLRSSTVIDDIRQFMGLVWRAFKKFLLSDVSDASIDAAPLSGRGGGEEGLLWPPFADFRCSMQLYDPIRSESGLSWLAGTSQNRLLGAQALGGRAAKSD